MSETIKKMTKEEGMSFIDEMKLMEKLRILLPISTEKAGKHLEKILEIKNAKNKTKLRLHQPKNRMDFKR